MQGLGLQDVDVMASLVVNADHWSMAWRIFLNSRGQDGADAEILAGVAGFSSTFITGDADLAFMLSSQLSMMGPTARRGPRRRPRESAGRGYQIQDTLLKVASRNLFGHSVSP